MKSGGGHSKGSAFERLQAGLFSLWVSSGNDKSLLWRSTTSGARASQGKIKGAQYGDLALSNPNSEWANEAKEFLSLFCVELKHYKEINLTKGWLNEGDNFRQWWKQVNKESAVNKVLPMLVMKQNFLPVLVTLSQSVAAILPVSVPRIALFNKNLKVWCIQQEDLFKISWLAMKHQLRDKL